jgi:hypothetical protein
VPGKAGWPATRTGERAVPKSVIRKSARGAWLLAVAGLVAPACQNTPIDLADGPAPLRMPRPVGDAPTYEDSLTGGEVFAMYCNQCHNARALGERNFINYENVAAHMRVRANLTGKEHEKLLEFLRRWHDIPGPTPPVEPSPKRLIYSQPIAELRDQIAPAAQPGAAAQPPGAAVAPPAPAAAPAPAPGAAAPAQPAPAQAAPAGPPPAPIQGR